MKLAIIHYQPLEYYPPVTNLIDYLAKRPSDRFISVRIYTCINVKGRQKYSCRQEDIGLEINKNKKIKETTTINKSHSSFSITRSSFPKESDNGLTRLLKYLHYNLLTLIGLIFYRPNKLIYYESYSVWPVYIYTKYFNRKCHLFIHNHEYESKKEYEKMMTTVKYYHTLEKKWLYPKAQWISQTNADRLKLFHQDHPLISKEVLKVMPNYPPRSWQTKRMGKNEIYKSQKLNTIGHQPKAIKMVYVGSLSFQSTYLKEVCEWVQKQDGKVQFDVFAYNLYSDIKTYLQELNSPYINYYEQGIEYNEQPKLLDKYQVGLILYKSHNQNFTFNAPNKLFEYLACGLDVWYPDVLQGPQAYNTSNTYPKVVAVDFEQLNAFNWQQAIDKTDCEYKPAEYYCEDVYKQLVIALENTRT